ncbi:MAG: MFS family permease [Alphaproteobacteria bacterium]|jgi:MFS family permease
MTGLVRRNVLLLALCQALFMTGASIVITVTALAGSLCAPVPGLATLPLALQFVATMVTTIPASFIMRRFGRRTGFIVGALVGSLGGVINVVALMHNHFILFSIGSALIGVQAGFAIYYRFAAADSADEDSRPRAISLVMAGGVIAAFTGPNLARGTIDLIPMASYAGAFAALAVLQVMAIVLLAFVKIPRLTVEERKDQGRPLIAIISQPKAVIAILSAVSGYSAMTLVMTSTPLAVVGHNLQFADAAFIIQWHVFAMFAPSFVTGTIIKRIGVVPVIAVGAVSLLACIVINLQGVGMVHFISALILLGIGWNFMFVGGTTLLTSVIAKPEQAKVQGLNDFLVFAFVAAATLSSGAVYQALGWQAVNLSAVPGVAIALMAALWLALRRPLKPV